VRWLPAGALALVVGLTSLASQAQIATSSNPFSEIPLATRPIPSVPAAEVADAEPPYSYPAVVKQRSELYDPRNRRHKQDCGTAYIAVHVLESGELDEARVAISSGYPYLDATALDHARKSHLRDPIRDAPRRADQGMG
jgi:TonB family protein